MPEDIMEGLDRIAREIRLCTKCSLHKSCRHRVPGEGDAVLPIMFVGEAPGVDEDRLARPFCLDENTRVLTADLTWRPIGNLEVGDELLACDEYPPRHPGVSGYWLRAWRIATVAKIHRRQAFCYKITTPDGALIATPDHRVLGVRDSSNGKRWLRIDQLQYNGAAGKRSSCISFVFQPWDAPTSYSLGWLAGFFDGEGHVAKSRRARTTSSRPHLIAPGVGFAQNEGPTCDRAIGLVNTAGFTLNRQSKGLYRKTVCWRLHIKGGLREHLRFLGTVRPSRLLQTFMEEFRTRVAGSSHAIASRPSRVLTRELAGIRDVVDIQTTTGTFIAEGFIVHNCGAAGRRLNELLAITGIRCDDVRVENTVKCLPPKDNNGSRVPPAASIIACHSYLERTIELLQPSIIVPLGATALGTFLSLRSLRSPKAPITITESHGRAFWLGDHWIFPMYHPAWELRSRRPQWARDIMEVDIRRLEYLLRVDTATRVSPWSSAVLKLLTEPQIQQASDVHSIGPRVTDADDETPPTPLVPERKTSTQFPGFLETADGRYITQTDFLTFIGRAAAINGGTGSNDPAGTWLRAHELPVPPAPLTPAQVTMALRAAESVFTASRAAACVHVYPPSVRLRDGAITTVTWDTNNLHQMFRTASAIDELMRRATGLSLTRMNDTSTTGTVTAITNGIPES